MRKLFFILIISCSIVNAENISNEVYLDLKPDETYEYKTFTPKTGIIRKENKEDEDYIYHPMEYIKQEAIDMFFKKKDNK